MCRQLLKSIGYCEETGSGAWSVSMLDRGFRLNVGQVEALTCFYTFWDRNEYATPHDVGFLDLRFLISGPDAQKLVERLAVDHVESMSYRSVSEPHWAVTATLMVEGEPSDNEREEALALITAVQSAHRHFVARAAHTPTGNLRKRSNFARYNCAGLVAYARQETETIPP
jgi:uncharacterized protein with PIN domain